MMPRQPISLLRTVLLALLLAQVEASDFIRRDGDRLMLGSATWHAPGVNCYYLMYKPPEMVDDVLEDAVDMGLRVVRTWGFIDRGSLDGTVPNTHGTGHQEGIYFQYWDPLIGAPAYNDGANGLQRLDYLVAKAGQLGLRLIITLTNNWEQFGGVDQYCVWYGLDFHDQFFSDERTRGAYKAWITHLTTRVNSITGVAYRDDPTIMAWELMNEPRCVGGLFGMGDRGPGPGSWSDSTITDWVAEMSAYLKSIDPNHLVMVGDEGFAAEEGRSEWPYSVFQGVDHKALIALPDIDIATAHLHPDFWFMEATWGDQWISDHARWASEAGKPLIFGEYALLAQGARNTVYRNWNSIARAGGADGALAWMLAGYDPNEPDERYPDYDGFTFYHPSSVSSTLVDEAAAWRALDNQPPIAMATASSTAGVTPFSTTLSGTGSVDPDGDTLSYSWNFGDGESGLGASLSHAYLHPGTYTATLTVSDGRGGCATATVSITVDSNQPPVVDAGPDSEAIVGVPAPLMGTVSDDGPPEALLITWIKQSGPGFVTFGNENQANITATFSAAGSYVLRLTAHDGTASDFDECSVVVNGGSGGTPAPVEIDPVPGGGGSGGCGMSSGFGFMVLFSMLSLNMRHRRKD